MSKRLRLDLGTWYSQPLPKHIPLSGPQQGRTGVRFRHRAELDEAIPTLCHYAEASKKLQTHSPVQSTVAVKLLQLLRSMHPYLTLVVPSMRLMEDIFVASRGLGQTLSIFY